MRKVMLAIALAALAFGGGLICNDKDALRRLRDWIGPRPPGMVEFRGKTTEPNPSGPEKDKAAESSVGTASNSKSADPSSSGVASSAPQTEPSDSTSDSASASASASTNAEEGEGRGIPSASPPPLSISEDRPVSKPSSESSGSPAGGVRKGAARDREIGASRPAEAPRPLDAQALTSAAGMPEADPSAESPPLESPGGFQGENKPKSGTVDPQVRRAGESADDRRPERISRNPAESATETTTPTAIANAHAPADWRLVQTRMKRLGISRYWLEGEPNGRCRFHCLVPVSESARTVGRQFEAEASDPLSAAESALRRVALWKATEDE